MSGLDELMEEVAASQRAQLRRRHLEPEVARRLATARAEAAPRRTTTLWRSIGLAAVGAAVATLVVLYAAPGRRDSLLSPGRRAAPLSFAVGHGGVDRPGRVGEVVTGGDAGATAATFSDGSEVTVTAGARARVVALDGGGAVVRLEEGRIEVHVVHRAETRWQVTAGDYRVLVTGTRFAVEWRGPSHRLLVRLREGSVEVSGPGVTPQAGRVRAGQELRVDPTGATLALASEATGAPPVVAPPAAPDLAGQLASGAPATAVAVPEATSGGAWEASLPPRRRSTRGKPVTGSTAGSGPGAVPATGGHALRADWRALATQGHYHEALGAALSQDFGAACRQLSSADLMLLGDVARLDSDVGHAEQAYRSALRRFPAFDRPAFALGVVSFEARRDYGAAAAWFTRYLRAHPAGPLATEAAGRLLESLHRGGETDRARTAAVDYLREHPDGPQSALARSIARP